MFGLLICLLGTEMLRLFNAVSTKFNFDHAHYNAKPAFLTFKHCLGNSHLLLTQFRVVGIGGGAYPRQPFTLAPAANLESLLI